MRKLSIQKLLILMCGVLFSANLFAQAPLLVPGNEYAFRYTTNGLPSGATQFGMFFNAANPAYELRNGAGAPVFSVGSLTGNTFVSGKLSVGLANPVVDFTVFDGKAHFGTGAGFAQFDEDGDLTFNGTADYLVGVNDYAFRSSANENFGLFFSNTDYVFRNAAANPLFSINATNGNVNSVGSIAASGGNSNQWNAAFGWGDHGTEGYIKNESDPQVGAIATNSVPRFNGSQLVTSNLNAIGNNVGIGTTTMVGLSNFTVESSNSNNYGGMYVRANGTTAAKPFYGYSINGAPTCWTYVDQADDSWKLYKSGVRMTVDNSGKVGIGTTTPGAKLEIENTSEAIAMRVDNTYSGASTKYGTYSNVTATGTGTRYAAYNLATANGTDNSSTYGTRSYATGNGNAGTVYGVYSSVSSSGTGNHYGVYTYAPSSNPSTSTKSWALYASGNSYFSGDVRMGYTSDVPGYKLAVNGKVICEELKVQNSIAWPDYVFEEDYKLMSLEELEASIKENKHLPGIPNAAKVEAEGISVGDMQVKMMEKIEEMTLHMIELKKENKELAKKIESIENY